MTRNSVKKWDFRPLHFAQKCPQNAGNAVSETQIPGGTSPRTPRTVSSHLACRPKIGKSGPDSLSMTQYMTRIKILNQNISWVLQYNI